MHQTGAVVLKAGREKSLQRRHPWVFSGAIDEVLGKVRQGETVEVRTKDGQVLGYGAYSPHSQITVRMWTFDPNEKVDHDFFRERIRRAIELRRPLIAGDDVTAYRLVYAESDGLPGVTIDRYGEYLVCQFSSAGAELWRHTIVEALGEATHASGIYERSDVDVRRKEGLRERTGLLAGKEPPDLVEIREGRVRYLVDVKGGHKTGFYLDQRENRAYVARFAAETELLNCFSYTGSFGVAALAAGARHVTQIDSSGPALDISRKNIEINHLDPAQVEHVDGNVFQVLRRYREEGRRFDVVVLDPPKFAEARGHVQKAGRGYKDINLLGFTLLRPGGLLFTFSCSGNMEPALFQKIVADAALDAGREAQLIGRLSQASDHPVALSFPEGAYLQGLVCRVW